MNFYDDTGTHHAFILTHSEQKLYTILIFDTILSIIRSGLFLKTVVVRLLAPSLVPLLTSIDHKSTLGAGTDDKTSFHPLFDFCGEDRADRPECLFWLYKPSTTHCKEPTEYLVWNGRVLLDYKDQAIRAFELPLTISSKIGQEEARLEAMLRYDLRVEWPDILARILRRGATSTSASKLRNQLVVRLVRFRLQARLLHHRGKPSSEALETYLLTIMTAEMVAKNTTRGLVDIGLSSDEKAFIELLSMRPRDKDLKGKWRRELENKLIRAEAWAQAQTTWEARNPTPAPSCHGQSACTTIESIVAFKLASMSQHRRDGGLVLTASFFLPNAAPRYDFETQGMREFFGDGTSLGRRAITDANDPYGLLGSRVSTKAQVCLADFLLEPARMQYLKWTLAEYGKHKPIFTTNPDESYWDQHRALQNGFLRDWAELGRTSTRQPPVLHGLLKLEHGSMTWNSDRVPILNLVENSIDSCTRTLEACRRQQAQRLRDELRQLRHDFEYDETDGEGSEGDEESGNAMMGEREGGEDDVVMGRSGGAEVAEEDEMEEGEEL